MFMRGEKEGRRYGGGGEERERECNIVWGGKPCLAYSHNIIKLYYVCMLLYKHYYNTNITFGMSIH